MKDGNHKNCSREKEYLFVLVENSPGSILHSVGVDYGVVSNSQKPSQKLVSKPQGRFVDGGPSLNCPHTSAQ